jgi:hypothetical protein
MIEAIAKQHYPAFKEDVEKLVQEHLLLKSEPLLLALYYAPKRNESEAFLFEVSQGFGQGEIDPEREMTEFSFLIGGDRGRPEEPRLHLILTSPDEFRYARRYGWRHFRELRDAWDNERVTPLYVNQGEGAALLQMLERKRKSNGTSLHET